MEHDNSSIKQRARAFTKPQQLLENAVNLELKSMTVVAGELGFDEQESLILRNGGTSLGAMLHGGK
jgi:hypothetical protein